LAFGIDALKLCALLDAHGGGMSTVESIFDSYDKRSKKRATNLSLSGATLDAAKSLKINVSQVCDNHLREVVRLEQARRWRKDHEDFIAAYNETVEAEGLPLDEWRTF
jgi:antitoxin CcdA